MRVHILYFVKWFVIGALVSTLTLLLAFVGAVVRVHKASPDIGAVSFTFQWALTWILVGAIAVAIVATGIKVLSY
jgi:hypothetical protein